MIQKDYDIIVIGAGPAGSVAAAALARENHDVLLVDRQVFPRDKVCGDGIPPGTMRILAELGCAAKITQAGFYPIDKFRFQTAAGRTLDIGVSAKNEKGRFFIAPRKQFDELLKEYAVESGAQFFNARVTAPLIENSVVKGIHAKHNGQDITVRSKLIIGADGVSSVVARHLKSPAREKCVKAVAIRAYLNPITTMTNCVEFYWLKELLPGYAWIFPLNSGEANIGLWLPRKKFEKSGKKLKDLLFEVLEKPDIKKRLKKNWQMYNMASWPIYSVSTKRSKNIWDGALLAGDAAAFTDPLSGEGIYNAIRSGQLAAQVGHRALLSGNVSENQLAEYDKLCRSELGPTIRRSFFIRRGLMLAPQLLEWIFAFAGRYPNAIEKFGNRFSKDLQLNRFHSSKIETGPADHFNVSNL